MYDKNISPQRLATLLRRFGYALVSTQLFFLLSALNAALFNSNFVGQHNLPQIIGVRLDVVMLGLAAVLVLPIYRTLKKGLLERAIISYFWLLSVVVAIMAILEGGLNSVPVMAFPIIAIFSALYTDKKVFLSICAFFCLMVILMGMNHHYGWFEGLTTTGAARIADCLILVLISANVAWLLGAETKQSMSDLMQEHQQVLESQKVIQHLANTDSLTGLLNRTAAQNAYQQMQADMDTEVEVISLYFIDLDNFKNVNDLFDHYIGDELLITVAERLKVLTSQNTAVCRLGGDEFVLFVKTEKYSDHNELADKIITSLSKSHSVMGASAGITASVGITIINDHDTRFDDARKQADMAMYKAKQSGKNTYSYYSAHLHREYMKNLTILHELKDALNRNLLDLYFQPKILLKTGKPVGAEALLRWTRGNPNKLTADEFIPVIESTELIHSIGNWVLQQACQACRGWHDAGHQISVAVNISALQLARSNFHEVVAEALRANKLSADFLELEFTEHFLIQENSEIREQLHKLKQLGVRLAIDDFGTGYSNMSYLTRLEVDVLKLDKSFISQIKHKADSLAVVTAIIEMAAVLNMQVVAEGVEKESEYSILKKLGGAIGQGFLWSKALSDDALLQYLEPHAVTS